MVIPSEVAGNVARFLDVRCASLGMTELARTTGLKLRC